MRSNYSNISILANKCVKRIAKLIVGTDARRSRRFQPGAFATAAWCWADALAALGHRATATCATAHVTGGAGIAMRARSGRSQSMRRLAAS